MGCVQLGITGFSGAGKTAFITSLVQQLTAPVAQQALPFWQVMQQGRYRGAVIAAGDALVPRFPYEQHIQSLYQAEPVWPQSTLGLSQLTLQLRYHANQGWRQWQKVSELTLELIDYPGEWLLDLPMLQHSYDSWCEFSYQLWQQSHRQAMYQPFAAQLAQVDLTQDDELTMVRLSQAYSQLLQQARTDTHATLLQPGRLLQPGHLAGSPVLQLWPLLPSQLVQSSPLAERLRRNFADYQQQIIKPFYRQYFAKLDRQLILIDCLGALNAGYGATMELQQALLLLIDSFRYGEQAWWQRLWQPKIQKVLFAASKVDHLTLDQQQAILLLLQQMLQQPLQQHHYQLCQTSMLALSAVVSTTQGQVPLPDGRRQPCVEGHLLADRQWVRIYPGDVPISMPSAALFAHHKFDFAQFAPPLLAANQRLPHLRLDHALEFLLGDRLT